MDIYLPELPETPLRLPLFLEAVAAGFPSPAEDYVEQSLDLNTHMVQHPAATFFVRAVGDSMRDAGIYDGDILVVDRSLDPTPGRVVIAAIGGGLTVKRLMRDGRGVYLQSANPNFPTIRLSDEEDVRIWGTVTFNVHRH
jgi:DNA polymerase V